MGIARAASRTIITEHAQTASNAKQSEPLKLNFRRKTPRLKWGAAKRQENKTKNGVKKVYVSIRCVFIQCSSCGYVDGIAQTSNWRKMSRIRFARKFAFRNEISSAHDNFVFTLHVGLKSNFIQSTCECTTTVSHWEFPIRDERRCDRKKASAFVAWQIQQIFI